MNKLLFVIATSLCAACGAPDSGSRDDGDAALEVQQAVNGQQRERAARNVRVSGPPLGAAQNQPSITRNPRHPKHLLVGSHQFPVGATALLGADAAYYSSLDGGKSFGIRGVLPGITRANGGEYQGASDPEVACGPDGSCYYSTYAYDLDAAKSAITVSRTKDQGRSWSAPAFIEQVQSKDLVIMKGTLAIDQTRGRRRGQIYVSYVRISFDDLGVSGAAIYLATSGDNGATWSAPVRVSPASGFDFTQAPRVAVLRDGSVAVVYENFLDEALNQHLIQRSSDGGQTWSEPRRVAQVDDTFTPLPPARFRVHSWPMLAVNPVLGTLFVAWSDQRNGSPDILVTSSSDAGQSWSEPARANSTPLGAPIEHALPSIACGPQGICAVSFVSSRRDPNGLLLDVYVAEVHDKHPPDRQKTIVGKNVRVTDQAFDPSPQFQGRFLGDYFETTVSEFGVHPAWTDTRVAEPNSEGVLEPQQDIFTARVPLRSLY